MLLPCHGPKRVPKWEEEPNWQSQQPHLDISPKSESALELHSRAAPSVEAHHRVNSPNTGRNSGGRGIINKMFGIPGVAFKLDSEVGLWMAVRIWPPYSMLPLLIVKILHFFYIANMQFLNMHLIYTLILHSNDLNQLSFLLSYMSICPPKKLSLSFSLFLLNHSLNQRTKPIKRCRLNSIRLTRRNTRDFPFDKVRCSFVHLGIFLGCCRSPEIIRVSFLVLI